MNKTVIENQTMDEERALYHLLNTEVYHCTFAGPADGESALKECRDVVVRDCRFSLRYPLWHANGYRLLDSVMDDKVRAPIWYAMNGYMENCEITGVKCLRECDNTEIVGSRIVSPEFGWRCRGVTIRESEITSEYFLFECRDVTIDRLKMKGKYSFQYVENMTIEQSELDTKDAFWHSKNVTVRDSVVKGEYLGWFSDGLTLINCHIVGTQPLCYCTNLKLMNCTMEGTDLSFEYSDVEAELVGEVLSVKNPRSGYIVADAIGETVYEGSIMESTCRVTLRRPTQ
ncbi:MAG: DUF3737 family protein [Ruminococcaceae bacterium]|nr:DUF3737 family protein [Oscillospiraceae bacterium]